MTWYWLPLLLILIPIIFAVVPRYRGRRRKVASKVFQESMTRRHTDKRKAEHKVSIAEWMVEFTAVDVEWATRDLPLEDQFVSSTVLQYMYKTDMNRFTLLMEHNRRMEEKLNSKQLEYYSGEYDAKRHSDYY